MTKRGIFGGILGGRREDAAPQTVARESSDNAAAPSPAAVTSPEHDLIVAAKQTALEKPNAPTVESVLSVHHYTDRLFKFRTSRPASFRFRSGEFVMLGLMLEDGKPLLRAYSVASPFWDEELEFYSIKVPDGPLTSRLERIQPGDQVLLGRKATGTLVLDALTPGRRLFLFSTGTGFAPFASLLRDPETYEKFEQVIVTHTCREAAELAYSQDIVAGLAEDPLVAEPSAGKVVHYTSCTRDAHAHTGRITTLIESGRLFADLDAPPLNPETDRVMICGSLEMIQDTKALVMAAGLEEGSNAAPNAFVIEKAFAG